MKKVNHFNDDSNSNSSLFNVKYKPKSARGLFEAPTHDDLHVESPTVGNYSKQEEQKVQEVEGKFCLRYETIGSSKVVSLCHGVTLHHQPIQADLGYLPSQIEIKTQSE